MPRFTHSDTKTYYYDINDPLDIDDEDEGWRDGVNRKCGMTHAPDVLCENHDHGEDFRYGIIKRQRKVNRKVDRVNEEEAKINLGCIAEDKPKARFYSRSLRRFFEIGVGDK